MLKELHDTPATEARVRSMLQEIVRQAVARMIARQESDTGASDADPEVHLGQIGAKGAQIREAQRARNWPVASTFAGEIARQNGMEPGDVEEPAVARQILALMRQLNDLSLRVERDFDDPLHAGRDLLLAHDIAPTREALKPPMPLSEAIEKACEEAPRDVETKIRLIGKLALVFFGDIPASSIVLEQSFEFLQMVWMLPKGWGKAHGRNRHGQAGKELCPLDEIREADAQDARLVAEITSLDTLSIPDQRRRLVQELTTSRTENPCSCVSRNMVRMSCTVSRAAKLLDDELAAWRNRPLGDIKCLILDARYEKMRHGDGGIVRDAAVLSAIGRPSRKNCSSGMPCTSLPYLHCRGEGLHSVDVDIQLNLRQPECFQGRILGVLSNHTKCVILHLSADCGGDCLVPRISSAPHKNAVQKNHP